MEPAMVTSEENQVDQCESIMYYCKSFLPDVEINQHLLDHPSSDFVIKIYERLRNALLEEVSDACCGEDVINLESDNTIFELICHINYWFKSFKLNMILTLTDLYEPTAKRTRVRLWVLANYLCYMKSARNLKSKVSEFKAKAVEYELKNNEVKEYRNKLAAEAEVIACKSDTVEKLKKELQLSKTQYADLKSRETTALGELHQLKQDLQSNIAIYESQISVIKNMDAHVQQLKNQIVSVESYNSLQKLKECLTQKQEEMKRATEVSKQHLLCKKPSLEHFENVLKKLNIHTVHLEEVKKLQAAYTEKNLQLQYLQDVQLQKSSELQEQLRVIEALKANINALENKIDMSKKEYDCCMRQMEEAANDIKRKQAEECEIQSSLHTRKDLLELEILNAKNECNALSAHLKNLCSFHEDAYKAMLQQENSVTSTITSILKKF